MSLLSKNFPVTSPSYIIKKTGIYTTAIDGDTGKEIKKSTDASTVIQTAIDTLPVTGGLIHIKEGTFEIATAIETKSYVTIQGSGNSTKLEATDNMTGVIINENYGTANIIHFVIRDLDINGGGFALNGISMHTLDGGSRVYAQALISHCRIYNCDGHACYFDDAGTSKFENNYFGCFAGGTGWGANTGDGLHLENHYDPTIVGNHFLQNGGRGLYSTSGHTGTVTGNYIAHNTGDGIHLTGTENSYTICGNTVAQNGRGIVLDDFASTTITGNIVTGNTTSGISLVGGARQNVIQGNVLSFETIGINVVYSATNLIQGNYFRSCAQGILVDGSFELSVSGNLLNGCTTTGIIFQKPAGGWSCDDCLINGNEIHGGTIGIQIIDGDDISVLNNRIEGSTTGIDINDAKVVRCHIQGNNWQGCTNNPNVGAATTPRITSNIDIAGAWWATGDAPN